MAVITTRCTLSSVSRKLFCWMRRSMYISARIKHSFEHEAYLCILYNPEMGVCERFCEVGPKIVLHQSKTYLSRYAWIPIPGAFSAWNLVTWPGSDRARLELEQTSRSSTAARTSTIAWPSAICSGLLSMLSLNLFAWKLLIRIPVYEVGGRITRWPQGLFQFEEDIVFLSTNSLNFNKNRVATKAEMVCLVKSIWIKNANKRSVESKVKEPMKQPPK